MLTGAIVERGFLPSDCPEPRYCQNPYTFHHEDGGIVYTKRAKRGIYLVDRMYCPQCASVEHIRKHEHGHGATYRCFRCGKAT